MDRFHTRLPRKFQLISLALGVFSFFTASQASRADIFVDPILSGTTPSGLLWSDVATGNSLPLRTTTAGMNGTTGAVAYFNTETGLLQIDPKGLSLTTLIFTYSSGTTNVTGSTPGPFLYPSGTTTNALSPTTGTPRTFPAVTAVTGLPPTTFAARVGMTIGPPLGATLATSGDLGNIASDNGFFNQPWAFPSDLVDPTKLSSMVINDFMVVGQTTNLNINILGYGNGRAMFQYSVSGVVGNQLGPVIPVVPEPSNLGLALVGVVFTAFLIWRRKSAKA